MLIVLNAAEEQVLQCDFFDGRPKDAEVWRFLIAALRTPQAGDPRRPAAVCITRKTWFRSWKSKLDDIGIECRLDESVPQIDRWYLTALPQMEKMLQAANMPVPADAEWSKVAALPQVGGEIWQAVVQQLPVWIQIDGEPKRPWVCLVVDNDSETILATEIEMDEPTDDWLLKGVWQALNAPAVGEAHCPAVIHVGSDRQREILAAILEPLGIKCMRKSVLPKLQDLISELAARLGGPQQRKTLIRSPGVTTAQVGSFFEAAADFYRARPWREVPGDRIIRVTSERFDSGPWYAVVMGQSGIEQGLALYEDIELLHTLLTGQLADEESERRTSAISVTYGEAFDVAPEDLDEVAKHDWPVAGPEAYPCVLRLNPGMALRTPLRWELELLEGCLRCIPEFLRKRTAQAELDATVAGETLTLRLEQLEE